MKHCEHVDISYQRFYSNTSINASTRVIKITITTSVDQQSIIKSILFHSDFGTIKVSLVTGIRFDLDYCLLSLAMFMNLCTLASVQGSRNLLSLCMHFLCDIDAKFMHLTHTLDGARKLWAHPLDGGSEISSRQPRMCLCHSRTCRSIVDINM